MFEWKPDEKIINTFETHLEKERLLDESATDLSHLTVREMVEIYRKEGWSELADYFSERFKLDAPLAYRQFTNRESIEEMRKGTPAGINYYGIAEGYSSKIK